MGDDLNVGKYRMLWETLKSPQSGEDLLKYVKETAKTPADYDYLKDMGYIMGTDTNTARKGSPGFLTLINNFFGKEGAYKGQDLGAARSEDLDPTSANLYSISEGYKRQGIAEPPNLLSAFFGKTTPEEEGLVETSLRPSKGYPFVGGEGAPVYDVTPYANFRGFKGDKKDIWNLYDDVADLKPGEAIKLAGRGLEIDMPMSIDLNQINYSIGKTERGDPYLALADSWDFGGGPSGRSSTSGGYGELMDYIGTEDINFYGRFPIDETDYSIRPKDSSASPLLKNTEKMLELIKSLNKKK